MSAGEQARAAELRAAFEAGSEWRWHTAASVASAQAEAARRYPDPAEPRVVTDLIGAQWRYLPDDNGGNGVFQWWDERLRAWVTDERTGEIVWLLAGLAAKPFTRDGVPCATAAG